MTHRVLAAGGQRRRADRHAIVLDARVRTATVAIRSTSCNSRAKDIWISVVSLRAGAYRFVIDDVTDSVRSTGARILADGVHARPLRGTIVVLGAFDFKDGLGSAAGTTAAADIAAGAHAYHGANRMRRQDPAFGWFRARLNNRTRVLAFVVQASKRMRTVAVLPALGSDFRPAIDVWISGEARRAAAYR